MNGNTWQLQEAKNKFSQLVDKAMHDEPQIVTKHGNNAVVVISIDEYEKITKPEIDLVEFFLLSPLRGIDIDITRNKDIPRNIEF